MISPLRQTVQNSAGKPPEPAPFLSPVRSLGTLESLTPPPLPSQGYGNVGRVAAELLCQRGHKLVAVSDIFGGIENQDGIDVNALGAYVDEYKTVKASLGCRDITPSELLEVPCDILLPAAVQSVIHEGNAGKIQAKLIMECANGPTTPEAEKILESRGVIIVPDVLVNCGSAIVCSFERTQGLTDSYWDRETVRQPAGGAHCKSLSANGCCRQGAWCELSGCRLGQRPSQN